MLSRPSLDQSYLEMLRVFARRSTCARREVAAILVDARGRVLSVGVNGVPSKFAHCTDRPCPGAQDPPGSTDRCEAVHAEVNAVLNCADVNRVTTAYLSCTPCFTCAKMLVNLPGLKRVVVTETYADARGLQLLILAGVEVVELNHGTVQAIPEDTDIPF